MDWRERQLAGLIGHLQHIASTQVLHFLGVAFSARLHHRLSGKGSKLLASTSSYFRCCPLRGGVQSRKDVVLIMTDQCPRYYALSMHLDAVLWRR